MDLTEVKCVCGHWKNTHDSGDIGGAMKGWCKAVTSLVWGDECPCHEYRMDNLEYLRLKHDSKH